MTKETTIYPISHEGIEDLKGTIFGMENIQKIEIVSRENETPVLIISYKQRKTMFGNGLPEIKKLTIK